MTAFRTLDQAEVRGKRVLVRRRTLEPAGGRREPGRAGGRPAALYRFGVRRLEVTDQFAVLRPPGH